MPTYAIIGATGATGSALLTLLLDKTPKTTIHAYARSKPKLLAQQPSLAFNSSVRIFDGSLTDIPLIASCISGVDAIFVVVGVNENVPGVRIAQDTAHTLVAALCYNGHTRSTGSEANGSDATPSPRLIFLSSSSVNPDMFVDAPQFVRWLLTTAFKHTYADLALAESYLRLHRSWLHATFIQPGGLVDEKQKGHDLRLSGREKKPGSTFLSYLDLAAGMIEVAESPDKYDWAGVGVIPTSADVPMDPRVPLRLVTGVTCTYAPWTYPLLRWLGAV
ncbi:hypothetical protein MMC07_007129 [Pseudocyphellaria aurata]|nr:hypothetical protein [Pseudocyphellaria aurata]